MRKAPWIMHLTGMPYRMCRRVRRAPAARRLVVSPRASAVATTSPALRSSSQAHGVSPVVLAEESHGRGTMRNAHACAVYRLAWLRFA